MNSQERRHEGSMDQCPREVQMAAVDAAMRYYFNSDDWIAARGKEFPGLRRT